jgi:hypothetical protein
MAQAAIAMPVFPRRTGKLHALEASEIQTRIPWRIYEHQLRARRLYPKYPMERASPV